MKRFLSLLIISFLLLPLISIGTSAAANISANGNSSAYPGDEITLTVKLDTDDVKNALAVRFETVFDAEQIVYNSNSSVLSGWKVSTNELSNGVIRFLFECDEPAESISGKTLIKLKFKLSSSLIKGESVSVLFQNISIASMENEVIQSDFSYSIAITQKSSDATLYSLSIGGVTLDPAFSSDVTSYTATVDYRTTPLKVNYKTNDPNAKAKVTGTTLKEGKNTVTITVTAEDGTTKKYTVSVTMKENPNPLSSDNKISSLAISTGTISPEFDPDVNKYTITVDSDTKSITLTPTANDSKATVNKKVVGITEDETSVVITCTAEDSSTRKYTFTIIRENDGTQTSQPSEDTESADTQDVETTAPDDDTDEIVTDDITTSIESDVITETEMPDEDTEKNESTNAITEPGSVQIGMNKSVPLWSLLLCSIISLILGAVISALIFKRNF